MLNQTVPAIICSGIKGHRSGQILSDSEFCSPTETSLSLLFSRNSKVQSKLMIAVGV